MKATISQKRDYRYWLRLLSVAIVAGAVLLYAGYLGLRVYAMARPARRPLCCTTPANLGWSYEDVSLETADGLTLLGWYIPSSNRAAVILLHGYGANRVEMLERAGMLAQHGYGVLLYDQRASGESEGRWRSHGWMDADDVQPAIDFLAGRDEVSPDQIGILGFSVGGQIALRAAAESDRLQAVVAEEPSFSVYADLPEAETFDDWWFAINYGLAFQGLRWWTGAQNPSGVVECLPDVAPRPVLWIVSGPVEGTGYWLDHHFYEEAGDPKTWWHVPEAWHGQIPELRNDEYEEKVVGFFDAALLW